MKRLIYIGILLLSVLSIQLSTGCKKKNLLSKGTLEFSVDTVLFDTVFTTVGSTTKQLKIYNKSKQPVRVQKVTLMGGTSSPFRVNLDGISGTNFSDVMIPANDSLFMFVEVTLGENNVNDPMIIEDQIQFITNNVEQTVQLAAWGQDAYFHYQDLNSGIWPNDKPHVIYGYAIVEEGESLTIQEGTQIYMHKGAVLYVDKAALFIEGTAEDKVVIQGDRLEAFYEDVKGQYYGIYFSEALSSSIEHAIIKNGTTGIHVYGNSPSNGTDYTLTIKKTEIYNHASYGIFNYSGGKIKGENVNVHNNNVYAYFVLEGGDCEFKHSQFLSYGSDGAKPAIALKNYFTREDGITYIGSINEASFYNSIIYGGGEHQIVFDTLTDGGQVDVNFDFNTNFIRQKDIFDHPSFVDNVWNTNPKFESLAEKDYKIKDSSPCKDAGNSAYAVPQDIEDNSRNMMQPDVGAYELD